jgi:methylated-DNA-protein-cysteine methyltransferase-like protein
MKEKRSMATKTNKPAVKGTKPIKKGVKSPASKKTALQRPSGIVKNNKVAVSKITKSKKANSAFTQRIKRNEDGGEEKLSVITPSGRKDQSFFQLVYEVARQIPKGRVTSYGAIAACLGTRLSARMVGWAMNGAHNIKPKIPAHRVVNRNGMLSGKNHFETPDTMKELLEKEGTSVVDDTVVNFKEKFWDPSSGF